MNTPAGMKIRKYSEIIKRISYGFLCVINTVICGLVSSEILPPTNYLIPVVSGVSAVALGIISKSDNLAKLVKIIEDFKNDGNKTVQGLIEVLDVLEEIKSVNSQQTLKKAEDYLKTQDREPVMRDRSLKEISIFLDSNTGQLVYEMPEFETQTNQPYETQPLEIITIMEPKNDNESL